MCRDQTGRKIGRIRKRDPRHGLESDTQRDVGMPRYGPYCALSLLTVTARWHREWRQGTGPPSLGDPGQAKIERNAQDGRQSGVVEVVVEVKVGTMQKGATWT